MSAPVLEACGLIATATREAMGVVPETRSDPDSPGTADPRCEVRLRMELADRPDAADPSSAIRSALEEAGWAEDPGATADGPGTSAFAFYRAGVRCEVSAGRPASLVNGVIADDGIVYVEAGCFELP